jgi:hypothetical protein
MTETEARRLFKMALNFWIEDRCFVKEIPEATRARDEALEAFDELVRFRKDINNER